LLYLGNHFLQCVVRRYLKRFSPGLHGLFLIAQGKECRTQALESKRIIRLKNKYFFAYLYNLRVIFLAERDQALIKFLVDDLHA